MERCLQILPVNRRIVQTSGGWHVLTSIEIWDDRILVHSVRTAIDHPRELSEAVGDAERQLGVYGWELSDDLGTEYQALGGGGSGLMGTGLMATTTTFAPSPPVLATMLRLFAWDMQSEQPIEVPLTG